MPNTTIDQAFAEGAKKIDEPVTNPDGASDPVDETVIPPVNESPAPVEPSKDQVAAAVAFMDRLKDPAEVQKVLLEMAAEIGVEIVPKGKKKDEAAPSPVNPQDTLNRIISKVPEQYQALFQAFLPGIKELISEDQKDVRTRLDQQEQQTTEQILNNTLAEAERALLIKHPDLKKFDVQMSKLAEKMPWDASAVPIQEYMENLYVLASNGSTKADTVNRVVNKINANASSGESSSAVTASGAVREGSKLPTLNEAFSAALKGQRI